MRFAHPTSSNALTAAERPMIATDFALKVFVPGLFRHQAVVDAPGWAA
jgi:hypothetical protein